MTLKNRNLRTLMSLFVLLSAGILAGCGGSDTEDTASESPTPAETPADTPADTPAASDETVVASTTSAGLTGTVSFDGPRPERAVLKTESDENCVAMHSDEAPLLSDKEVVSEDGGVMSVFVYIKDAPEGDYPPPTEQVILDQVGCRYIPHVLGVQVGQELVVKNSDPTLHNVRASARTNRPWNNALPEGAPPRVKKFKKPEMVIRLKCDIHPWMTGVMFSMDHPFFSVTDESGAFSIEGLPAGDYTLVAWHESFGEMESEITIPDGAGTTSDFAFSASE